MRRAFFLVSLAGMFALTDCTQMPKPVSPLAIASEAPSPPPLPAQLPALPKLEHDLVTDPSAVMAAQRELIQLGYNLGKPDGILGPATQKAIRAFQKDHNLPQDERLTFAIADKLKALADAPSVLAINARPGDMLVYNDGEIEIIATKRTVEWGDDADRKLVAIRPGTSAWPAAARAGLE